MSAAQMKIPKIKDLNTNNDRFNKSSGTCEAKHLSKGRPPKRIVHFFNIAQKGGGQNLLQMLYNF